MVEIFSISAKDQSRLYQIGTEVLPGIFAGYALCAGEIWEGDILVADVEDFRILDVSEIYVRRLNAKEVLTPKNGEQSIFPFADESVKLAGRDQVFRTPTLIQDHLAQG